MKKNLKVIIFYAVLILVIIIAATSLFKDTYEEKGYSDIVKYFENEQVHKFVVDEKNQLVMELYTDKEGEYTYVSYKMRDLSIFYNDLNEMIRSQHQAGIIESYDYPAPTEIPFWVSILPYIIMGVLFILLWIFMMNQASGRNGKMNSFGRAKVKTPSADQKKVLFTDVAGADEEKEELREIVEFLKNPTKFQKLGAKIPHGVLLMGPPGTGKTLLAKAVAGEAGVPFYSISGSDFVEMYVGVGASRVRDLFETAKRSPSSIIFIDEIDAVGRHRGAGLGGGHDEREQTLNQLLVEMDGFESGDGVIVIAATNRPDILDPALLRPGRFDRQVTVNYPDIAGREEILKVHARNKPLEAGVDLKSIAKTTAGFTGADLANLLNEAALLAARRGKSLVGMDDMEDAFIKVLAGPQKKSMVRKESEKKKTAYHEAGHAILAHVLPTQDPVQQISIIPSGNALGYTLNPPVEDRQSVYKQELKERIAMLLAGRAAEELIFEDVSGGASNDIQRATATAKQMVIKLGMSEVIGLRSFGSGDGEEVFLGRDFSNSQDYSDETAAKIDNEIHRIISEAYETAKTVLRENMDKLHFVAEFLVRNEVMDGEQFKAAMDGEPTFEELEEMANAKRRKSREENDIRHREQKEEEERLNREEEARQREEAARNRMEHDPYDFPKD
ncbi:MAG: ATP-dependent zinc metalloprotease FtsH [Clostridia bacterium]|nr:ATP-dependent zinc metalloprotease FtsH [Clostridia bacterium]